MKAVIASATLAVLLAGCGNASGYKNGVASDCYAATSGQVICPSQRPAPAPAVVYQTRPVYVPVPTYVPVRSYGYGGGSSYDADELEDRVQELEDRIMDLEFEQMMRD
jgi:subtilisin family serine protease